MENASLLMENGEYEVSSSKVLELVDRSHCTAYDCEFVALAKELIVPLITCNKKILKEFPETAYSLDQYLRSSGD